MQNQFVTGQGQTLGRADRNPQGEREPTMTTTGTTPTLGQVKAWINATDDAGLDEVLAALQARHDTLHSQRAEQATIGRDVTIVDVTPAYLNGLDGTIEDSDEDTVSVRLTCESTGRLRFSGQDRYDIGAAMNFLLEGVPASCCYELANSRTAV